MKVVIDPGAGFCFGVKRAISTADQIIASGEQLGSIGEIVHNPAENQRLRDSGMQVINKEDINDLNGSKILIRSHGEPPKTYEVLRQKNLQIVDATCPIVIQLQRKIKNTSNEIKNLQGQIVIVGKRNHPEIIGLNGQIDNHGIIIEKEDDLDQIDFTKPIRLFAQTTSNLQFYNQMENIIHEKLELHGNSDFVAVNSICRHVTGRVDELKRFAGNHEVILFVGGENSSNGKYLYGICKAENERSYYISRAEQINSEWLTGCNTVGITGATSTPEWQLKSVAESISRL